MKDCNEYGLSHRWLLVEPEVEWCRDCGTERLASVDTLPKGQDAKQGLAGTEGSAVTPKAGDAQRTPHMNNNPPNPPCNTDLTDVERLYPAALKRLAEQTELIVELETKLAAMQQPVHADVERLSYLVACVRQGGGPSVRCEGPGDYEIGLAREWVERVLRVLRENSAALLVSNRGGEGRQDFSRLTLRHNIETILRQWRDAHPNTLLDKIMSAIPRTSLDTENSEDHMSREG